MIHKYQIHAIRALQDNYIWVICHKNQAVIIDPGSADEVIEFFNKNNQYQPIAILITHHHHDHTGGVAQLIASYPECKLYAHQQHGLDGANSVNDGDVLGLLGLDFVVWQTAGHTDSHLSYVVSIDGSYRIFCGDTLFSAGCGRIFTGTAEQLFASISRFAVMPEDTLFYAAHEYTLANLKFASMMATDNYQEFIQQYTKQISQKILDGGISLPTSLANERKINVFVQACDEQLAKQLADKHRLMDNTPLVVFAWLREQKNQA
ncbi:hydroxyacylglutathione hydrolase [Moraxella cuniculi]|uniref:Hydroxyacylglutathione hydrolase n=1 Tax=Moraxella cuniculi TaxID=34061 RepID=A0A448GXM0_9GAMM|nr:hydroxyacylglutathione hydrolase [Moraxella cuniculi]VEG13512.1 Hydroxyacylglutathione hydrolase [Moraxella cuniculi]